MEPWYGRIFEQNPGGIALLEADGRFLEANPALRGMIGAAADGLLACVHPGDVAACAPFLAALRAGRRPHLRTEARLRREDGAWTWTNLTFSVLDRGDQRAALVLVEDVTERRVAEEALAESQHQLLQSQKMEAVGRLAGGVAHDFNNMLTAIKGFSTLLSLELDAGNPLLAYVEEIDRAVDRSTTLTRQLLAFSRTQPWNPTVLPLDGVVSGMGGMLRRLIGEDVRLELRPGAGTGHVRADAGQLEQVLMNLVVNARDALRAGGSITVTTRAAHLAGARLLSEPAPVSGDFLVLSVQDTGCGMSPEVQARIFEPFFTTKAAGEGTGLGLSTVYGIVLRSGGHLDVESQPGRGTRFDVYLPRVACGAGTAEGPSGEAPELPAGLSVLLVEDEAVVRELARRVLQRAGCRVTAVADGLDACRHLERLPEDFDVLVTDVLMPRLDGFALAGRVHEAHPGFPILFLSGYPREVLQRRAGFPADAPLLQKPFAPEALLRAVRERLAPVPC